MEAASAQRRATVEITPGGSLRLTAEAALRYRPSDALVAMLRGSELWLLPLVSTPADRVLAQPDFGTNGENRWDAVADDTLCWPYGLCVHDGRVAIADSGNNRIMIWELA